MTRLVFNFSTWLMKNMNTVTRGDKMERMAFCGKYDRDYTACLKNV
jgi:hypothetical protein